MESGQKSETATIHMLILDHGWKDGLEEGRVIFQEPSPELPRFPFTILNLNLSELLQ